MKKNHFMRIFIAYMLIILINSLVVGYLSMQLFKYILMNNTQKSLESSIKIVSTSLQTMGNITNIEPLLAQYSKDLRANITLLDSNGKVIAQGYKGFDNNKNYKNQSEIKKADNEGSGYDLIYDDISKVYILNMANKVNSPQFNGYIYLSVPLREIAEMNKAIISYSLIGVVFLLVSSFILSKLFEKDVIRPIQSIIDNIQSINGEIIDQRTNINSDDVIGVLAHEHNKMLDRIKGRVDRLKESMHSMESGFVNINIGILVVDTDYRIEFVNPFVLKLFESEYNPADIQNKKVIELIKELKINNIIKDCIEKGETIELETSLGGNDPKTVKLTFSAVKSMNDSSKTLGCFITVYDITQLKKFEQMGYDFVSNATHELKTPLTSIKGFVETLKDGAIEDRENAYRFLEIIEQECERLGSIINDILQLSELQNIDSDVNLGYHYIQDITSEVVVFINRQAERKGITISKEVDDSIPLMLLNKNRIKQMLINIIDNAVKYTQSGGEVKVRCFRESDQVIISVKDNGIGIPNESISRLFERFYRVDKGRSRNQGGTGLGLSIVKHIVELYHGIIEVNSVVGKGTEFVIKLPLRIS